MTADAWLTLGILVVLFGLLVWDGWPTWVVFGAALTAILTLGLASEADALQGFANTGVLTVVVLYIVAAGMYRTGAISMLITRIMGQPKSETEANAKLLPLTAAGSAFLNNTPIVAMLVPVIADLGRSARLAVSKLYMAVSDASILGGSTTLIGTSTNLIIAGLVLATFGDDLGVFFPTRIGLPGAIVGLAFLLFVAPRLLGQRKEEVGEKAPRRRYRAEFFLPEGSQLAGRTLLASGFSQPTGAELLSVRDDAGNDRGTDPELELADGDVLTFSADIEAIPGFWSTIGLLAANPRKETGRELRTGSSKSSSPSTLPSSEPKWASYASPSTTRRSSPCPATAIRFRPPSPRRQWRQATTWSSRSGRSSSTIPMSRSSPSNAPSAAIASSESVGPLPPGSSFWAWCCCRLSGSCPC